MNPNTQPAWGTVLPSGKLFIGLPVNQPVAPVAVSQPQQSSVQPANMVQPVVPLMTQAMAPEVQTQQSAVQPMPASYPPVTQSVPMQPITLTPSQIQQAPSPSLPTSGSSETGKAITVQ